MGAIYQLTFFLATALLAIVITIFVLAVSLLGRAIEAAAVSEKENLAQRKENNTKEMAVIRKKIEEAEPSGQIPKGLTRELAKLEKKDKKFEKEQGQIRKAPDLLTARGGVFYPGAFLVAALVLSSAAWYLSNVENINWAIPLFIWMLGLVAIGYGIYRICKSLNVLQDVAITSEEAWIKKTVEAFKIAEKELEEEKRPILRLSFRGQQPPFYFHVKVDSETKLEFFVGLRKGEVADNVTANFHLCPGFSFPSRQSLIQDADQPTVPNFVTARVDYHEPIMRGADILNEVVIKAPPKAGSFPCYYNVKCRGFVGELEKFEIIVE